MANIVYVRQPYPRGDGEAILRAKSFIWDEPFLVLFWDDIIDHDKSAAQQLVETFERKNTPVISTVKVNDKDVSSYGIIESSTHEWSSFLVDKFLEKPSATETKSRNGVVWKYVLTSDIFQYLEQAESQRATWEIRLADAFELMRQKQDIYGLEIEWKRYDTWSKIGFLEATVNFALKHDEVKDDFIKLIKSLDIK
jgi:UTP--glucose-1-phosphate uridylyltransferase